MKILLFQIIFYSIIEEYLLYNESIPFNWTKIPQFCYIEDFILSNNYRPYVDDIYPMKGCNSDERNSNYATNIGITNITFQPKFDFFFPNEVFPPPDFDPPTYMTFRINFPCLLHELVFNNSNNYSYRIYFGRNEDYLSIPKISKRTGQPIEFIGKKAILNARLKYTKNELQDKTKGNVVINFTSKDFDFYDYEGEDLNVTFDGYELDLKLNSLFQYNERKIIDQTYCQNSNEYYAILIRVYDLPRMKVQGLFQYKGIILKDSDNSTFYSNIYTVDTRNIFFQNISMFYNQRVNVTKEGNEPTGEDSGFWVNTPCNQPQMATIMVDYFFFETIHKMQKYGYEFNDRFQLRIHTPFYRKTLTSNYSLFRYQWNETYEKPRVFIHPIYKYKKYCEQFGNCTNFNYEEWSTDPKWTKYIIDIKNEIIENEIRINFTELEKIYAADGFNRTKLVININNTMTPHITQISNGLWAELFDTLTNDWVMKTKTTMDEVHGYLDNNEADPYRDFYLTCEIPDNITNDDIEFIIKKFGVLQTAHLWFRLDVFNKGITKMYPPRFNIIFKFPPEILVTRDTFAFTYQYYNISEIAKNNSYWIIKELKEIGDKGVLSNTTFDYILNKINISELHPNYPNGDDTLYYTQKYEYFCYNDSEVNEKCIKHEIKRQFLYYFYDLSISFSKNNTGPIEIIVYQIKYVPYHSKDQINRGLHRWNPHHAGWNVPKDALFYDQEYNENYYSYYHEPNNDNFYHKPEHLNEYINRRGPTGVKSYNGPDCIFGFSGGSTIRNNSCEYWSGIMPDKPFTNYARDIYEEHIAYRTLIDDDTFTINTRNDKQAENINFGILDPYPGKFTGLLFQVTFWNQSEKGVEDGEPKCKEFYEMPKVCEKCQNYEMPIYNVHKNTKEFYVRIKLPEGISVNSTCVGKVLPCYWAHRGYSEFAFYFLQDYLCYYVNDTYVYAFNSNERSVLCTDFGLYDIAIQVDGIYIHENITNIKKGTGLIKFGFYVSTFFKIEYPRNENDDPLFYNKNVSLEIKRNNMANDGISNFALNIIAKDWFIKDNVFRIDFSGLINNIAMTKISYDGNYNESNIINLKMNDGFNYNNEIYNTFWSYMNLPNGNEVGHSYIIAPYLIYHKEHPLPSNYSFIHENETTIFGINFTIENYRSFKPIKLDFYMTNLTYKTVFQHEILEFSNSIPYYLLNLTVKSNSYYTNDRAVYTFNFITDINETYKGDYFEFKTSWKTAFKNINEPDEEGYYTQRIIFDKNLTLDDYLNMTLYKYPILNPDTLEEQYIKDIKILDNDGYIIAIYEDIIPIKMKNYIGFKHSEINTVQNEFDPKKFDINFELVPEILIDNNDTLKIKFSSGVLLQNYSECLIDSKKGLNIDDFIYEINIQNNELVLYNIFNTIGETEFIFDNKNSNSLIDQELLFTLKGIPINQSHNNEKIFSIEIKTERDGIITQRNIIPSTAIFECQYRCKTCEKENINLCLSCIDEYPIYYKNDKQCHKNCPNENYFTKMNEDGNIECYLCEAPCETCNGEKNNCTSCNEPYFLENNHCVMNCSEGYELDYSFGNCYQKTYLNDSKIEEKIIYVNVTVPEPYPIYIEKNICGIYNESYD